MNWQNIRIADNGTHFLYEGKPIFNKSFIEVLKFHAPGIAPVRDESGSYHIKSDGSQLYKNRYSRTFGFYCNRAAVTDQLASFHLNELGQAVYEDSFSWVGNYQEELCTVRNKQGSYFHIDLHGNRAYSKEFLYAGDYKDGIACVKNDDNFYRHIDREGKLINKKSFDALGVFHKKFATAKDKNGWFHIDKEGCPLYSERYATVEPFYNGYALVTMFDNRELVIDEKGGRVISL